MSAADVIEIQQVLARYVIAIDTLQPELMRACFTDDAVLDLSGVGAKTVDEYVKLCTESLPGFSATQHHLGLPAIHVDGDRASSRCYFMAQHIKNEFKPSWFMIGGWYEDDLIRQPQGWRIAKRRGVSIWGEGNPEIFGGHYPTGGTPRGAAHAPPSWMR